MQALDWISDNLLQLRKGLRPGGQVLRIHNDQTVCGDCTWTSGRA